MELSSGRLNNWPSGVSPGNSRAGSGCRHVGFQTHLPSSRHTKDSLDVTQPTAGGQVASALVALMMMRAEEMKLASFLQSVLCWELRSAQNMNLPVGHSE